MVNNAIDRYENNLKYMLIQKLDISNNFCNFACLKFKLSCIKQLLVQDASTFRLKQCAFDLAHGDLHFTRYSGNIFQGDGEGQNNLRAGFYIPKYSYRLMYC